MAQLKIGIIMGSVREGRMNARVADWVESEAKKKFGESALIEVKKSFDLIKNEEKGN